MAFFSLLYLSLQATPLLGVLVFDASFLKLTVTLGSVGASHILSFHLVGCFDLILGSTCDPRLASEWA